MTTTTNGLLDRYQDYRVRRWQIQEQRLSGMLPGWRNRRRRRALAVTVVLALAVMFIAGLLCAFDVRWAAVALLPAALIFVPVWGMLRIVSHVQDTAPAAALDELEVAQRNTARSIGLSVTQFLVLPPVFYLIFVSAVFPDIGTFQSAYAGGVMVLATLLTGGCTPGLILAWNRLDPEPEA
ncbi:hypothetical protein [Nocardia goodfellowii]|uniref:Uncharacterized protein n=1 Tax=Nocardia goodfellowii TaxID=882446 RepID=A0ABS4Q8Q2_9NOCA|nr:hypothetical protein [Nocardia goodfellowii]MBP2188070.1 hypothetical protein [Nocardia goodfellowii]